jgi:hypothetical protein
MLEMPRVFPLLTDLTFSDSTLQTDSFLILANKMEHLVSLNIINMKRSIVSNISDACTERFVKAITSSAATSLIRVNFSYNDVVSNDIVIHVVIACQNIISLNLQYCDLISEQIMPFIVDQNCKHLTELKVMECGNIDISDWIFALNDNCNKLEKVSASFCYDDYLETKYSHIIFNFSEEERYAADDDDDSYYDSDNDYYGYESEDRDNYGQSNYFDDYDDYYN